MKTLYDRLKQEYKHVLETQVKDKFPATYESMVKDLKENYLLIDISYHTAMRLDTFLITDIEKKAKYIEAVYSMFNNNN